MTSSAVIRLNRHGHCAANDARRGAEGRGCGAAPAELRDTGGSATEAADFLPASAGCRTLRFGPHEHIFFQDDAIGGVHEIRSGTVIVYRLLPDGRRQVQDFAGPGELLGLAFSGAHELNAETLGPVETVFLAQGAFEAALETDGALRKRTFARVGEMLSASRQQALMLGRKSAAEKTATFLLFLESRFQDADGYCVMPMSRSDVADYLGLTLETVSRMLSRLKAAGIIELPHPARFRIRDRARLMAATGDASESVAMAAGF